MRATAPAAAAPGDQDWPRLFGCGCPALGNPDECMNILHYPHPSLLRRAAPVESIDDTVRTRVEEMFLLMAQDRGVGLAAPQVGWGVRLFVMNATGEPADRHVLANPRILKREGRLVGEEGCLSLPGIYIEVSRARRVDVEYLDPLGNPCRRSFEDFEARIVQHELDHLEGVTLVHRMSPTDRMRYRDALLELEQAYAPR
ncbi:MAG: peptide deformylase [Planctomycetota bacterium]